MSTVSNLSSSASVAYATQLAQTSSLKRSLNSIGTAVASGDMSSASSVLTSFIKANPQFASTSSTDAPSQTPINQDFQALTDAVSGNNVDSAKSAWTQIQSDLTQSGVTNLNDGADATAKLLAETKASLDQQILSNVFGTSGGSLSVASLIGGSSDASSAAGVSSSMLSQWFAYKQGGSTAPTTSAGSSLNTVA